ncbi:MAG: hypothetical protein PHQ43_01180 [Dehalococcoidales bacterium]|nr:hypothetical protein [Dehalococcoidales bacterium]
MKVGKVFDIDSAPVVFVLLRRGATVGYMRITRVVELSHIPNGAWVSYAEGVCESGLGLQWDMVGLMEGGVVCAHGSTTQ